ncbi:MAG: AMP-binding protein, partial [Leptolyngbya sp. SIO3F4]|nr:AMP-binding protein [Leptolyngbya sp. SIO3F4]
MQLHYTIPDLLDMGCANENVPALHHWGSSGWETLSYRELRTATEELALGFKAQTCLYSENAHGSIQIGLLLKNDMYWAMADVGSLLAGWVTVPIAADQSIETIRWIINDANLHALVVSDRKALERLHGCIEQIKLIVVLGESSPSDWFDMQSNGRMITTLRHLRSQGRCHYSPEVVTALKKEIHPEDLATIVYTADASGLVKGVRLSHKNLTGNIWAAFNSMPGLVPGAPEVALSFLPLNHIFARTFLYGHFGFGHDIYFSTPSRVWRHLATVQPTIFITVPRFLEKVYERIDSLRQQSTGLRHVWLSWCWHWAHRYQSEYRYLPWHRLQCWLLRHGVFRNLYQAFGGNIRYLLCGGAALRPEVMTFFNAVGIPVKQGYGLTETSSVLSYTRDRWLRE